MKIDSISKAKQMIRKRCAVEQDSRMMIDSERMIGQSKKAKKKEIEPTSITVGMGNRQPRLNDMSLGASDASNGVLSTM